MSIATFLWFDHQAEEAAEHYTSTIGNSRVKDVTRGPDGSVMAVSFELDGQQFLALNGGPHYKFSEAISIYVGCDTQDQIDEHWEKLSDGGSEGPCGWLKDRYGLSWQIIPNALSSLLGDPDPERAARAGAAMQKMKKIDIKALEDAAAHA